MKVSFELLLKVVTLTFLFVKRYNEITKYNWNVVCTHLLMNNYFSVLLFKVCCKVLWQCPPSVSEALLHQWGVILCPLWPKEDEDAGLDGSHFAFPPEWLCQVSNALGLESLCVPAAHQRPHGPRVCNRFLSPPLWKLLYADSSW